MEYLERKRVPQDKIDEFLARLNVSQEQTNQYLCISQRTPQWHTLKATRFGGSTIGYLCGQVPKETPRKALCDMLWPAEVREENWFMSRGTILEALAFEVTIVMLTDILQREGYLRVELLSPGICIKDAINFMAVSPDGQVNAYGHMDPLKPVGRIGAIEIKCPGSGKFYPEQV